MGKKLATISLALALAAASGASTALADPNNTTPTSPGACNMLNVLNSRDQQGYYGMAKSASTDGQHPDPNGIGPGQGVDLSAIMFPVVINSEAAGCTPANVE
jgi:hypothetical protein